MLSQKECAEQSTTATPCDERNATADYLQEKEREELQAVTAIHYTSTLIPKTHSMHLVDQKINPTIKLAWEMK